MFKTNLTKVLISERCRSKGSYLVPVGTCSPFYWQCVHGHLIGPWECKQYLWYFDPFHRSCKPLFNSFCAQGTGEQPSFNYPSQKNFAKLQKLRFASKTTLNLFLQLTVCNTGFNIGTSLSFR